MPMGIVSDTEFEREKSNSSPSKPVPPTNPISGEIVDVNKGRGTGNKEVPDSLRKVIGEESVTNGRQSALELAQGFGISPSSVSAYSVGANSTASYADRPNQPIINESKGRVANRALGKLKKALHKITDEKLDAASAKDLAGIAKDMSAVVRSMEPDNSRGSDDGKNNGPTFVFYAPQIRDERQFDVVHVKE